MRVHCDEGVANHIGPEPCAGAREGVGEASVGVRAGQPLSRERHLNPDADEVGISEGHTEGLANARASTVRRGPRPWHVRTLLVREPGDLSSGRLQHWAGPHREGEEP